MLKTLEGKGHQSSVSKSTVKELRNLFLSAIKYDEEQVPTLWPKKGKVVSFKVKSGDDRKSEHIVVDKQTNFVHVQQFIVPTLKVVHNYPDIYPRFMADPGAIKFILKGANVMAPGLTNQQAYMDDVEANAIVSVYAKDLDHALAIGVTRMSTEQIKTKNEGLAVQIIHFVGDGFWNFLYRK